MCQRWASLKLELERTARQIEFPSDRIPVRSNFRQIEKIKLFSRLIEKDLVRLKQKSRQTEIKIQSDQLFL